MTGRIVIVFALLGMVGCSGTPEPEPCSDAVPADTVRLEDFAFEPDCLSAESGGEIRLQNVGEAPHTFTVPAVDVSFDLDAGTSMEGTFSDAEPGRYAVTCLYHPQMTATLEIV